MYYVELKDGKIKGVYTKKVHGEKLCNDLYKNDGLILDEEIWQYVLAFGETKFIGTREDREYTIGDKEL